jgi:phenylacetate-CoA ligase
MVLPAIRTDSPPTTDRTQLHILQRRKLSALLGAAQHSNPFYQAKLKGSHFDPLHDPMSELPFTTRSEIEADQRQSLPYGTNLTEPLERYCRYHQTSGTGGLPVRWLDTAASWEWFKTCWRTILSAAGIAPHERLMFPFSFGPFIGFWAAFEGAASLGCLCLPAGGMSTSARLRMLIDNDVDAVFCTPTYALRMAETAKAENLDLAGSKVRALIVAGEPGGSVPQIRQRIETEWGARVFDHHGMTEIGSVSFECQPSPGGIHIIESEFIAEVIDPGTGEAVADGQQGELVLTNLGRVGSPLIRYRTGDLVKLSKAPCACGCTFARLEGGILARADDMFIVRGNNVFPTAIESVIRQIPEVVEFRVRVRESGALTEVGLDIESADGSGGAGLAERVAKAIQAALSFRADVQHVAPGSLPRFEMKAKRFIRERKQT